MAALFVVVHHIYLTAAPGTVVDGAAEPGPVLHAFGFLALGHFAVTVFIVLSGWSLALQVRDHGGIAGGARGFFARRFWRIVPTFWIALGASTVVTLLFLHEPTGTHWDTVLPFDATSTGRSALLLGDIWPGGGVPNHAYWSIPVEAHIYLLFPVLILALRYCRPFLLATGAVALSLVALVALVMVDTTLARTLAPVYYGSFVLAAVAALRGVRPVGVQVIVLRLTVLAVAVGMLVVCEVRGPMALLQRAQLVDLAVAGATTAALLLATREESRIRQVLSARGLVVLGVMAYSIYLIHAPVVQLVWQVVVRPLHLDATGQFIALLVPALLACLAVAGAFFLAVERHFLARRPQWLTGRPASDGARR